RDVCLLDKNDTVYQWNLQLLDLSDNKMERATFINNTLTSLCTLNLSHNHFWTLPTNLPIHLEIIDLSHNWLVKVLPGSLDRLPRLTYFYLHANRFSAMPFGVLDKMTSLKVIALGNNPWACHLYADISYLLSWTQRTPARVLGCPCHTQPICGGVHPGRTGGWHYASYNLPPLAANSLEQRADKWTLLHHYSLTKSKSWALLLHFDHISDLSVLHDSVTLVKIICMLTERRRNANLLVSCRRALKSRHFRDIQISTALNANDVAACRILFFLHF
uniref:Oligodendrocyte myelin glycoprotein a n=1 Tax=Oreochromis aureus TaxID=47969 RepID=A0A668R979_OREAU